MRINYDAKLNFEDVLLQPKRSTLTSRKDVDMTRKFTFRNSQKVMNFLPIFASNMGNCLLMFSGVNFLNSGNSPYLKIEVSIY